MGLMRLPNVGGVLSGAIRRVPDAVRECLGRTRRVWWYEGRVHIALRPDAAVTPGRAEAIEAALAAHPRVEWACVNAPLGRVIVGLRNAAPDVGELLRILDDAEVPEPGEGLEDDLGEIITPAGHAVRVPPQLMLAADAIGLAVSALERVLGRAPIPAEVAATVSLVESAPPLRRIAAAVVPDQLLPLVNAAAQALAPGGAGLAADIAGRLVQWRELRAIEAAWRSRERELCGTPERARARQTRRPRVRPVPKGPLERHADQALTATAGGLAAGVLGGNPRRGLQVGLAAVPKAASWAREGFAAELATQLARRGAVITDPAALRLLDRVDTVVADAEVLLSAEPSIGDVVAMPDADDEQVAERLYALFDPAAYRPWALGPRTDEPPVARDGDGWALGPLERLGLRGRSGKRERRGLAGRSAVLVLGLAERDRLRAVVSIVRRPQDRAHALVTAARRAGLRLVLAGGGMDVPGDPVETMPGGARLTETVRGLQESGATVLLISADGTALATADCGVGVGPPTGGGAHGDGTDRDGADRPPLWGAHVIGGYDPLATAAELVEAVAFARRAGERGVTLARSGSGVGALLALTGTHARAAGHAQAAVAGAAVLALAYGVWQAHQAIRVPLAPPLSPMPWHAMPVRAVLDALGTSERGLGETAARRRARTSAAALAPGPVGLLRAVAAELANPLTPVLAVGAIGSAVVGSLSDALLIGAVVGSSALVGGGQRVVTDRTVAAMSVRAKTIAHVLRDGKERQVDATDLVRGDVVVLRSGDVVPADCRIIAAEGLETDESSLTGESLPVAKTDRPVLARQVADRRSMVYEGTVVAAGEALAVVVAVGEATETGRALAAAAGKAPETGVEARLSAITRATTPMALGAALVSALSGVFRGQPLRGNLGAAISLAVAAVPEGLPLLVGAAQLAATRRLARRGVHARDPRTIEALGRVNVLCFDKTGTLTEGGIRLTHVADARHDRPLTEIDDRLRRVLEVALRATPDANGGDGHRHLTDAAVAEGAASAGVDRGDWERIVEIPFEPSRGFHAALGRAGRRTTVCVKGAPEVVLPRCRAAGKAAGKKGGVDVAAVEALVERLASSGHRVLAVAEGTVPDPRKEAGGGDVADAAERLAEGAAGDLTFIGLLGLSDVVRDAAAPAIARLNDAGVQIVMLTGDHPSTAGAIAAHVTGRDSGHHILTGTQIDELPDEKLDAVLPTVDVVARCTPSHKVRVVESFQRIGRVVAMTGDGANDAAGIRLADVGIALGGGTRAAQAAADLVVADDGLETIISALVEGRAMWASVREALAILVGGNLGEIAFTLIGALAGGTAPLSARQLLLVNLLTDLAPALAIAVRAPSEDAAATLLGEGPETSLGRALTRDITARAVVTTVGAAAGWIAARLTGPAARARTVGLVALVGTQLAQTVLAGGRDRAVLLSALGSAAVLAAVVQIPPISLFFGCVPLDPLAWGTAAAAIAAALLVARLAPALPGRLAGQEASAAASSASTR